MYDQHFNMLNTDFHTSMKPYRYEQMDTLINRDSLYKDFYYNPNAKQTWLYRKWRKESFMSVKAKDFTVTVDPAINLEAGRSLNEHSNTFVNTRGVTINGTIGKDFSFSSTTYENQAIYADYIDSYIAKNGVVPGQGMPKTDAARPGYYDFSSSYGYISYSPSQYFNFQLGHDKNFIGDGYRSLLLSDNSFNYPFFKITTHIWKLQYEVLYAQFLDLQAPHTYTMGYQKKYGTFHYLSYNVNRRLNIGLFEAVIWQAQDSTGSRGFDLNYLNPVIYMRPVEFSVGSPDNELVGLTSKFKINDNNSLYGQFMLDEFYLKHLKAADGWANNKYGFQVGAKSFNLIGVKNLNFQTEYNYVRPFSYSHYVELSNYAHYNQPLAHTLGSNFYESVSFLNYRHKSFFIEAKFLYAIHGLDPPGTNYGNDLFKSYTTATNEYGNEVGQGIRTTLMFKDLRIAYLVNPRTNLRLELGISNRTTSNSLGSLTTNYVFFGLKTALTNSYFDF
jgi:hypothetical protein